MQQQRIQKTVLGLQGEEIACKYLSGLGYKILARNWRFQHLEVDIIIEKQSVIHIVEVKTRASEFFERPQDAVTITKQKFLVKAANAFISSHEFDGEIQFDIISILLKNGKPHIDYIPDAFYPLV